MVNNVLRRTVPIAPRQNLDVSLQLRAGEAHRAGSTGGHLHPRALQCWHTVGISHQTIFFRIGRTRGRVYIRDLGEGLTSSGENLRHPLQSRVVPSGTQRGGPEGGRVLAPGGPGFYGFCHHRINCSSPQQMQRKTASGKCLSP